jgi:hypothetical protein
MVNINVAGFWDVAGLTSNLDPGGRGWRIQAFTPILKFMGKK